MKISKLLVLSALWLAAGSAMAAIVDGVRQKPTPQTTAFVAENTVVYLYNVNAKAFFTQGNSWATQASIGDEGRKMRFNAYDAAEGTYTLQQYNWRNASDPGGAFSESWRNVFFDSATALFCDRASQANYGFAVEFLDGGNNFLLRAASVESGINPTLNSEEYPNKYVGLDVTDNASNTALSPFLTDSVTHYITWALVTEEDYQNYMTVWNSVKDVFNKAAELKAVIDEAKAKNIDVADEEAVYLNEASTIDQLEAAIAAVKKKINDAAEQTATPDNPSDMTASVTNPSYEGGTKGWSGTAPAIGYTAGEFYQKNYNMYQDVTGIPNGVYAVKVKGYFRPGSTQDAYAKWATGKDLNAYLYAKAGEDSVAVALVNIFEGSTDKKLGEGTEYGPAGNADDGQSNYVPNNMQAGEAYFNAGRYQNVVFNAVDDGKIRIGLMKDDSNFSMNWTMFDQWELSYLGNTPAAYTYWINEMKKALPDYSDMGETLFTEDYLTAYNAAVTTAAATNKAEAVAAIKAINDANDALKKNIELWEQLQKVIAEAIEVAADNTLDATYTSPLSDWAEFDVEDILAAHDMTNDALETLIKEKKDAIAEARLHVIGAGADVTNLLTNPNFQEEEKGWTGFRTQSSPLMPVMGGPADNRCAEAWNTASFDLYQVVENAPVGVYEISVQGFYRYGRGDNAYNHYTAQDVDEVKPGGAPCYVYMNAKATPFQNVFDEPVAEADDFYSTQKYTKDGYVFPDGMISAGEAYSRGMFTQRAFGLVAKKGDAMRIGVKGSSNQLGDSWCIFDNFKLTWWGFDKTEYIQPVLEEELVKAKENVDKTMGKDAYEHLSTAIANAETALQGTEGKVMFDALSALFDVDAEVTASVEAFKGLDAALALLNEEMGLHTDSPALEDASNLMDEISGNIGNHVYDNADVEALIAKINEMVVKLRIPAGDPTDANPVDFSEVITNATYDENLDGWTCEAKDKDDNAKNPARNANYSNVELFGCNYDYYQEIAGLPAGIYRVGVTGFFRAGSAAEEWARKDSVKYSRAFIYAIGENGTMNNKALTRLAENFVESSAVESGYAVVKTDTVDLDNEIFNYTLLANTMDAAGDLFAQDKYVPDAVTGEGNVVTVKVGEDGKLRFGLYKKVALSDNDWTIWANWKLWYFGTNSANQPSGDNDQYEEEQGIAVLNLDKAVRVETFTLDGRKVTSKQRGIVIQRMTMPDGSSVVIKKIRK